jgi:type IV secretory pathway TrbL component
MLLPLLLLALKLKAAVLIPLFLAGIALIAGKALLIGKIALVLSAIIGLKKLLSQQKSVTYEIVSHPHHTSSHHEAYSSGGGFGGDIGGYGGSGSGGHGGWGRSTLDAQQLAYRGYQQTS